MTTVTQTVEEEPIEGTNQPSSNDALFTVIGLFLVTILVWVTVKGKLRDWFMK